MSTLVGGVNVICAVNNIADRLAALTPKFPLQPKLAIISHLGYYSDVIAQSHIAQSVYANFNKFKYTFFKSFQSGRCLGNVLSRCSNKATNKPSLRNS